MTQDHEPRKRYPCDRCGVPTRSVFEGENAEDDFNSQLDGGLHLTASGYYGGSDLLPPVPRLLCMALLSDPEDG